MLKPISRDLTQDHPVPAAAKGSSWIQHPPLAVNKVATSNSSCHVLPLSFPHSKERQQGGQRFEDLGHMKHRSLHMLPKPLASFLAGREGHKAGSAQKIFSWAMITRQLIDNLPQFTMQPSRATGFTKPLVPLNSYKIFLCYINDRTLLLAEASQKRKVWIRWGKSELLWMLASLMHWKKTLKKRKTNKFCEMQIFLLCLFCRWLKLWCERHALLGW